MSHHHDLTFFFLTVKMNIVMQKEIIPCNCESFCHCNICPNNHNMIFFHIVWLNFDNQTVFLQKHTVLACLAWLINDLNVFLLL